MRIFPWLLVLHLCVAAVAEENTLWVAGQQLTYEELEAELEPLMEAYWSEISSPSFRDLLQQSPDWRRQMVHSLLLRYPEGPFGDNSVGRDDPEFERSLNAVIEAAPAQLAPRVLMLLHCEEALMESSDACMQRHGAALDQLQPANALGPLFLAQAALDRGDVTESAAWMQKAAAREEIRLGYWAIVQAQFDVFSDAEPQLDDPLKLAEVARYWLAEGMVAHLMAHPVNRLGRKCQVVLDEPMMSGCLATAKAMKLPGTARRPYSLALAIEERIYERQGKYEKLAALALDRQSLIRRFGRIESVQKRMYRTGSVAPILEAYVTVGELDTAIDYAATATMAEVTGDDGKLVLRASTPDRIRCLKLTASPEAPECVTPEMVKAEVERLTDVLAQKIQGEHFSQLLAADRSDEAQIVRLQIGFDRTDLPSPDRDAAAAALAERFPAHPLANRLAADLCHKNPSCLSEAANRLIKHEPDDALGYLLAALNHLEGDNQSAAEDFLDRAGRAKTMRGAFGLMAATGAEVIARYMGPPPDSDLLGVWDMAPAMVSIGYAAAISLPAARLSRHCQGQLEAGMQSGCLSAARALQLPGGSLIELIMGLQLETRLLRAVDDPALGDAIDRLARARQLRDDMSTSLDRFSSEPAFHHNYLEKLGESGEVAALEWMLRLEQPEDA